MPFLSARPALGTDAPSGVWSREAALTQGDSLVYFEGWDASQKTGEFMNPGGQNHFRRIGVSFHKGKGGLGSGL